MWKRVHNNFINRVISILASANRTKIYPMPKLTLAGTTFTHLDAMILIRKQILANRAPSRTKIYQMPKLTLVGTTVTDIESGKQIDPDSTTRINNHHYIAKMIFNMQDLGNTTIIYNTTKPNKITYTNNLLKKLNKALGFGVGYDYFDCDFKEARPDLLFIDSSVNYLAKRIVKRFSHLQKAGRKAKQAVNA